MYPRIMYTNIKTLGDVIKSRENTTYLTAASTIGALYACIVHYLYRCMEAEVKLAIKLLQDIQVLDSTILFVVIAILSRMRYRTLSGTPQFFHLAVSTSHGYSRTAR